MENLTISQVSKLCGVTPRMLRHYEKMGLICPRYREDYAYRCYDAEAVRRLKQIVLLRKLRVPLKQIAVILTEGKRDESMELLRENLAGLDLEIASLSQIRDVLKQLVKRLSECFEEEELDLLSDQELVDAACLLTLPKTTLKESSGVEEGKFSASCRRSAAEEFCGGERSNSMEVLNRAEENLSRNLNVRILCLPPCTVAACHFIGENPEEVVGEKASRFVQESRLYERKPDARMFGFNHPNPGVLEGGIHGYEDWITIPEDMEVPEGFEKKKFEGGLYAVLTIPFPEFQLWSSLTQWVEDSEEFEPAYSALGEEIMGGCLEEHLNWVYSAHREWAEDGLPAQIDLMLPVRLKK